MANGYQGYTGYDDAAIKRQREMADALMQRAQAPRKIEHWTQGVQQLAEALFARQAGDKADTAEKVYTDHRKEVADQLFGQAFPDAQTATTQQLEEAKAFDLTPAASQQRQMTAALGAQVRGIADLSGDPLAALQYGQSIQKQRSDDEAARQKAALDARKPVVAAPGSRGYGDPDGDGNYEEIFSVPDNDTTKAVNNQRFTGEDGFVYSWNPQTNETKQVMGPNGKPLRAKESSGVTINMPGSVREGVDPETGRPAFVGIDPKDPNGGFKVIPGANPQSNMMSAETRSKFLALAPNAFAGISRLEELFGGKSEDPLSGKGALAAVASNIPFVGDVAARGIGGQEWQDFDQAWNAIELGVHIPAGAAVSPSEAERFLRANKPALNETQATKMRKIANVKRFYEGLQTGFNGDWNGLQSLLKEPPPSDQKAGAAPKGNARPLDAEEQQMVNELRALGKSEAEINAIIGQ